MNAPVNLGKKSNSSILYNWLSVIIVIAGFVLFYILKIALIFKWLIILTTIILALGLFFFISNTGIKLQGFIRDTKTEFGKIAWPARKEAVQFTWIVIVLVVIIAVFLWLVDSGLSWLFYSFILGR